jgi:uncharacterized membrane protein
MLLGPHKTMFSSFLCMHVCGKFIFENQQLFTHVFLFYFIFSIFLITLLSLCKIVLSSF